MFLVIYGYTVSWKISYLLHNFLNNIQEFKAVSALHESTVANIVGNAKTRHVPALAPFH